MLKRGGASVRNDVRRDKSRAERVTELLVWPALKELLGGGRIEPVESTDSQLANTLDMQAGIDYLHIDKAGTVRGCASRVQPIPDGQRPYDTFTIRHERETGAETEYSKRRDDKPSHRTIYFNRNYKTDSNNKIVVPWRNLQAFRPECLWRWPSPQVSEGEPTP